MQYNPIRRLTELGQSPWLDFLSRKLIRSGRLDELIGEWGVRGVTSNPKIFADAISKGEEYSSDLTALGERGLSAAEIVERLMVDDVREAADRLTAVHDFSGGRDGYVSLEVSPALAHDAGRTIAEARHLWGALARSNVFIKVPATVEGLIAIRELIGDGINVNVTLLFGLRRYQEVIEAYLGGLEDRLERGFPIDQIESVASFFVSRLDTLVDGKLEEVGSRGVDEMEMAKQLRGETAIACAKIAYQIYRQAFEGTRFLELRKKGARTQRLLWGSTGVKDPRYSDVKYVEALIGPETINTMPMATLEAYRDHGRPQLRLQYDLDQAKRTLAMLAGLGVDLDQVSETLVAEGVEKFAQPYEELISRTGLSLSYSAS
jgi:transaldolase